MAFLAVVVILLDQWSKWAIQGLMVLGESRPLLPPFVYLTLVHNTGAAFGMLAGRRGLLLAAAALLLLGLFVFRELLWQQSRGFKAGTALLLGGAAGNVWDRLLHGHVVDFIHVPWFSIFNVADTFIVCGGLIMAWEVIRHDAAVFRR